MTNGRGDAPRWAPAPDGEAPAVAETHSAWVVFLGDRAYKVKKPVVFPFLDFSTPEARRHALGRELELNRRLAPDVYLGVAELAGPEDGSGEPVLVMRRMPADRRLRTLLGEGAVLDGEIRAVARVLARFHATAPRSPAIDRAGSPEVVAAKLARDLEEMSEFVAVGLLDEAELAEVARLGEEYVRGRTSLFASRAAGGFVRDGHGDLLADDIFCLDDGPRILDCIEFDDELRHTDVVADLAFLMMDLERLGAPDLAARLLADYREFSDEHHPESLADFYVATRAIVRSKVACVRARQRGSTDATEARALLRLARQHLHRARVRLVLVGGTPGTGKSTVAAGLADRCGWVVLRSDEVRKDVAGVGHGVDAAAAADRGIYDALTTDATYGALLDRARTALAAGESVILDASWARAEDRAAASALAEATASAFVALRCDAPPEVADDRIASRRRRGDDVSDAGPEVAAAMRARFEPWPSARTIETSGPQAVGLERALAVVRSDRAAPRFSP